MTETTEEACATCWGEGVVFVDRYRYGDGHYTEERPCPECQGDYDEDPEDPEDPDDGWEGDWDGPL